MLSEFPRTPSGVMKRHITDEADARLAFYLPLPENIHPPGMEMPPRPQLPPNVFDAPLVRVFNFLRASSILVFSFMLNVPRNHVTVLSAGDIVVPSALSCPCRLMCH